MPKTPGPNGPTKSKPRPKKASAPPAQGPAYQPGVVGKFPFGHEMATFNARLPELMDREGDYVVIRGGEVAGVCATVEAAMWMGRAVFGLEGFLVKQIRADEPAYVLPHELAGWQS